MIGYLCKYTPIHLIHSFGESTYKLNPSVETFDKSNSLTHNNMCSYSKAVIEECYKKHIDKLILVNCCDSIRRLYDILKEQKHFKFVYLIDLPRKSTENSHEIFNREILKLIKELEKLFSKPFSIDKFIQEINKEKNNYPNVINNNFEDNCILLMGARVEDYLLNTIKDYNYKIYDLTCTSYHMCFVNSKNSSKDYILLNYCKDILEQFPCMRMCNINDRYELLNKNKDKIKGIIYHTVKFCDYYSFDYVNIKNTLNLPLLKIETDFLKQSDGQIKTRIDAFMESINNHNKTSKKSSFNINKKPYIFFAGIDSGSTSTNAVILDSNKNIVSYSVVKTGAKSLVGAKLALKEALDKCNLNETNLGYIVSTGYGRDNIPFSNESITEITCHAKGAHYLKKDIKTIIDIGGQDSKVIRLNDNGTVKDFAMNDKCAAGTGRFIENMCKVLDIPIENIGNEYLKWKKDLTITSMCTVFAESEVVSLIAQNEETSDIVHGICKSVSTRVLSLIKRTGGFEKIMMTGGVAKNIGVVKCLEELTNETIFVPKEPQIIGALGAAIFAKENFSTKYTSVNYTNLNK